MAKIQIRRARVNRPGRPPHRVRGALGALLVALIASSMAHAHPGHLPGSHGWWHALGDPGHALGVACGGALLVALVAARLLQRSRS